MNIYVLDMVSGDFQIRGWKTVQLSTTWQQYQVSGITRAGADTVMFQIGGGGTVTAGQNFFMWHPMVEDSGTVGATVTNFLPYSQRFTAPSWSRYQAVAVDNGALAPDGTQTGAVLTAPSGSTDASISDIVSNPAPFSGSAVIGSIWLRSPAGPQQVLLTLIQASNSGSTPLGAVTINLTTDWQRFRVSGTTLSTLTTLALQIGGGGTFTSGQTIHAWGAQMELASVAGPYVATAATPTSIGTGLVNLFPYSQQLAHWGLYQGSLAANATTAPDGSMTATRVTETSGVTDVETGIGVVNPALYDGQTLTTSVFLKSESGPQTIGFYLYGVTAAGVTYMSSAAVTMSSNWQRFTLTGTAPTGLLNLSLQLGGGFPRTGQVFDVWGGQLEYGNHAGPYIATSALPVTTGSDFVNALPNSQQMNGPTWGASGATITPNASSAPDGATTAAEVTPAGTTSPYVVNYVPNPSLYDGLTVTASVYLRLAAGTPNPLNTYVVLANVGDQGWGAPGIQPITVTTTWQRFSVTGTLQNGLTDLHLQILGGDQYPLGVSFEMWGAQLVVGSAAAPYMPSNGGTVTNIATGLPGTLEPNGLNEAYSYDSFGNILQNGSFNASYTANNQMFGYSYDAAGNLLSNGYMSFTWDAENRITSAGGATYIYDAEGNRVEKQGIGVTDTIYFAGRPIARLSAGNWTDLIYGPNGLIAEVPGTQTGVPVYRLLDHLGTEVGTDGADGVLKNPLDYTPFGRVFSGATNDPYLFTGKERDTESGLDYSGARYYASSMGRFSSPDPSGLYFADPTLPQSLNLYSYARNNPLIGTDPTGMAYCQWDDGTHDDSANTGVKDAVNSGTECTNAGGQWKHDDGLNDDGTPAGSQGPSFMRVDVTEFDSGDTFFHLTMNDDFVDSGCQLVAPTGRYRASSGTIALFQPDFADRLGGGIGALNGQGITPVFTDGYRTQAMQDARRSAVNSGASPFGAARGISAHQVGLAADLGVRSNSGNNGAILRAMTSAGLVNGANFKPSDPVHYYLPNARQSQNPATAASCAASYSGS